VTDFLTRDPAFQNMLVLARRAAASQASILVTGESGTGKNRLARCIHEWSPRRADPFVEVPCANLPGELLESELFGHERGAFTDAHEERPGRFERAHGGTLYLDEVQEIDPSLQAKVLRAIEERRFERLGGSRTLDVDIRIVASTPRDPERLVREGLLREDLFYRLNVVRLDLPSLRQRKGDIELLAREFLREAVGRNGLEPRCLARETVERLEAYDWPGNARELRHCMESASILAAGDEVRVADLPRSLSMASRAMVRSAAAAGMTLRELEDAYIDEVLQRTHGNKSAAARILGIHRKTLHEKLRGRAGTGEPR